MWSYRPETDITASLHDKVDKLEKHLRYVNTPPSSFYVVIPSFSCLLLFIQFSHLSRFDLSFQTEASFRLSHMRICCFSLFSNSFNWITLGLRLLVEQNKDSIWLFNHSSLLYTFWGNVKCWREQLFRLLINAVLLGKFVTALIISLPHYGCERKHREWEQTWLCSHHTHTLHIKGPLSVPWHSNSLRHFPFTG